MTGCLQTMVFKGTLSLHFDLQDVTLEPLRLLGFSPNSLRFGAMFSEHGTSVSFQPTWQEMIQEDQFTLAGTVS